MSSSSDLDAAVTELNDLLSETPPDSERELLVSIANKIEVTARELVAEHNAFSDNFDQLLSNHDTTEAELKQVAKDYGSRRQQLRDDLLYLQDELHTAMTPEEWSEVVQVLNHTGKAIASYTLAED